MTKEEFYKLRSSSKKIYASFKQSPVYCKALDADISFNAAGFEHLFKDGRGHYRPMIDARKRLELIKYAPNVIKNCQWFIKDKSKTPDIYYKLYGRAGEGLRNVVVTIRKIGNGNLHFYGIRYH